MKKLSIIGKDFHPEENVVGYYTSGERMKYWGKMGAFWGGIWGLLFGAAVFFVPGIGPVLVGGAFVNLLVATLEGAAVVGGMSAIGAGLYSLGIPKESVVRYEIEIKSDRYLLLVHGTPGEAASAHKLLERTGANGISIHGESL